MIPNSSPLVSVLVPVYNVERYVTQCVDSIINQTYRELQIVLFDDGSTDHSLDICHHYASQDNRIEVYHQENQGVATTRNNLLGKIKGDFVLFVDSDDWIEPDAIESAVELAREHEADIVTFNNVINDRHCKKGDSNVIIWTQEECVHQFLRHISFNGSLWNKLIRTSVLLNERFHDHISYGEDALFCWHILQHVKKVIITPNQYYHYRLNDASISNQKYDKKKMSGHQVWKQISEETCRLWPKYEHVAIANYAISDMWQLFYAAQSDYSYDHNIKCFQKNLRNHLLLVLKSDLINIKKKFFALIAAYHYSMCKRMMFYI